MTSTIFGQHYIASLILLGGIIGFLFWQLLYVIPLIIWCRRRRKFGMMKGVIIGAVITALVNGACFVAFSSLLGF
jgi:hypothetical protein